MKSENNTLNTDKDLEQSLMEKLLKKVINWHFYDIILQVLIE